jgi:hypothetical protein
MIRKLDAALKRCSSTVLPTAVAARKKLSS